jgi:hypothetical protein
MISSKLFNFCKLIAILLALFIIYRVSTNYITNTRPYNDTTKINKNTIEHFAGINYSNYISSAPSGTAESIENWKNVLKFCSRVDTSGGNWVFSEKPSKPLNIDILVNLLLT